MTSMTRTTSTSHARAPRPSLRPLALPTEHGGWGFLFEPLVLGLAVVPSWAGALLAVAFTFGFLTRQPLKLALQDALRGKSYPRTRWCWIFASSYAAAAAIALAGAVLVDGPMLIVPIGLVVPLGLMQVLYDANNRSRALLPELGGAVAMSSSAAAIALAGNLPMLPALALSGVIIARAIPAIVYVRALLARAHGQSSASWPPIALHALAIPLVALIGSKLAAIAMALLFVRATIGLARPIPPARRVGWTEIAWGTVTVALAAAGRLMRF